jgi:hypothetical protein
MMIGRLLAKARGEARSSIGTAELSTVLVVTSLVAGVLFGDGLSRTALNLADGMTWLSDDPTGEVLEVNPATGRPEVRMKLGAPGDDLDIAQYDGRLIVTNRTTGELTSFDLTSILASGQRRVSQGQASEVLLHDGSVFLLDRDRGTIAAIDPVTMDAIGEIWLAPGGLTDAAIDDQGTVWAINPTGELSELRWSESSSAFVSEDTRQIDYSGAGSVLVGHERGVSVFGADEGIVVQVGTGRDIVADAPKLAGELSAPDHSPADLVPVAAGSSGTVVILSGGQVQEVDVAAVGCDRPERPEVFDGTVYVPCPGDGKVVRLGPDGRSAGAEISTPGQGDPELVLDDGNLIINVPGDEEGVLVEDNGTVSTITRYDETLEPTEVATVDDPPKDPPSIEDIAEIAGEDTVGPGSGAGPGSGPIGQGGICLPRQRPCPAGQGGGGGGGVGGPSNPPSTSPSGSPTEPLRAPRGVTATVESQDQVRVTWRHDGPADEFVISEDGGAELAIVDGASPPQAVVPAATGQPIRFVVTARYGGRTETSVPSNSVTPGGRPAAAGGVSGGSRGNPGDSTAQVDISWNPAQTNGSAIIDYTVVATDAGGTRTLTVQGTSASYTTSCPDGLPYCDPGPVSVTVTPRNDFGAGAEATGSLPYVGPTAPPLPAGGTQLVSGHTGASADIEGTGSTTLNLNGAWAGFGGTCRYTHSGNVGPDEVGTVACNATSLNLDIQHNAYLRGTQPAQLTHRITFTAANGRSSVTSATYTWTVTQQVLCPRCQIP